jgi:hypothetical protein
VAHRLRIFSHQSGPGSYFNLCLFMMAVGLVLLVRVYQTLLYSFTDHDGGGLGSIQ